MFLLYKKRYIAQMQLQLQFWKLLKKWVLGKEKVEVNHLKAFDFESCSKELYFMIFFQ